MYFYYNVSNLKWIFDLYRAELNETIVVSGIC